MTSTATPSFCLREPTMTPSTGETSEKSRPTASTIWSFSTTRSLVGSKPTQPVSSPHHTDAQAWVASAPCSRGLPRRGNGAQITRNVSRRQAEAAKACDHRMGKVLADAVTFFEHLLQRSRNHRGLGIVFEFGANTMHQVDGACQNPARRRKAFGGVSGGDIQHRHQRTGKDVTDRRRRTQCIDLECRLANPLPH